MAMRMIGIDKIECSICYWPGCDVVINGYHSVCRKHWDRIPQVTRNPESGTNYHEAAKDEIVKTCILIERWIREHVNDEGVVI